VVRSPATATSDQRPERIPAWRQARGLEGHPRKTRITPTLRPPAGTAGCDVRGVKSSSAPPKRSRLGFTTSITPRNAAGNAHQRQLSALRARHQTAPQAALIQALNGVSSGGRPDVAPGWSKATSRNAERPRVQRGRSWGRVRHPKPPRRGAAGQDGRRQGDQRHGGPSNRDPRWGVHREPRLTRPVNIQGNRRPADGEGVSWRTRLGRHPGRSPRGARRLTRQQGRGAWGGRPCTESDGRAGDHLVPNVQGGKDVSATWQRLHGHGHEGTTAEDCRRSACHAPHDRGAA
jgi:hypothetical protein